MSKNIEVASWNVRDRINDDEVLKNLLDTEPDLAVLPESYAESDSITFETDRAIRKAKYDRYSVNYDDEDGRKDRHALTVIVKPELVRSVDIIRTAGRNSFRLNLIGGTEFMGVHQYDRRHGNKSAGDLYREKQALHVISRLGHNAIVAGDFNDMHRDVGQAPLLRSIGHFINWIPSREPSPDRKTSRLNLAQRLTQMASGSTMEHYTAEGFMDADPDHVPTKVEGQVKAQIDRIITRGNVQVVKRTTVEDANNLSDHKRIRATLRIK